jgi:abortive infection bacteriophage resistance protein
MVSNLTNGHIPAGFFVPMLYEKRAPTFEQQAELLLSRGLEADKNELIGRLVVVSYYRLGGYWHPFLDDDDQFQDGITLDQIWLRYTFDRRLRVLMMDAIERIEISVQTATFRPLGLWGGLYRYSVLPFHGFIFKGMLKKLTA